ncbi:uncharacterized protein YggT (Ycf19 family) [Rhodobium orientis]|uniref:YggT family protein n=1 Tax=Rhodobium orientis TaxID=34017 RepID=A0A327JHJ4_9HYPH|nr:YggT family protein [Rhodobium orientis]MBB4305287.1 uncharacterized protein YggT (Ycf19 family) [Rhodobium orientis]MBK5949623.1 hypothetical protein [Rhodobium orientis]RAI25176.1 hypothetical protein CH339_19395 [Rhodobium orientis]
MPADPIAAEWYYHVPNYLLAILMYMTLGRLVLSFFFQADAQNVIWRSFVTVTEPAVRIFAAVTPRAAPLPVVLVFTAIWLLLMRFAYLTLLLQAGYRPTLA